MISLHTVFCVTNILSLALSSVYDTLCAVKESSSVFNCSQELFIEDSTTFQITYTSTTIFKAACFMTALYVKPQPVLFCGFKEAFKQLSRKGSFWSLNATFLMISFENFLIIFRDFEMPIKVLSGTLILFNGSRLMVAYVINYVPRVKYPQTNEKSLLRMYTWLAYWETIVLFLLATAYSTLMITLDIFEKVTPLGKVTIGSHSFSVVGSLVLLAIKASFEGRLFLFFWNKLFHGNKDLFSSIQVLKSIIES